MIKPPDEVIERAEEKVNSAINTLYMAKAQMIIDTTEDWDRWSLRSCGTSLENLLLESDFSPDEAAMFAAIVDAIDRLEKAIPQHISK